MQKQLQEHSLKYQGAVKAKKQGSLVDLYERKFDQKINQSIKEDGCTWADYDALTEDNSHCREIKHYIETTYDLNKFDLVAQKNDAVLAKALGKAPTKITTEEDDAETKASKVQQVIPYEAKKWFEV